jgi:beta-ribofuranosylaminobenzene 5'-phosphate synthase
VQRPGITARAHLVDRDTIRVVGTVQETTDDLAAGLRTLRERWDGPGALIEVVRPLPQHSGFGSKTTSLLAVGYAYGMLCGRRADLRKLSALLGRGRTSGASTGLAAHGGFLVDGGHRNPPEFYSAPREYLRPSRFAAAVDPPTPIVRLPFPEWPVLILMSNGRHLGGAEELAWFQSVTPIPPVEAARTAQLVFLGLAPAIAEHDYDGFCAAVDEITFSSYFKREQIRFQGTEMIDLLDEGRAEKSVDAIALSVTGPACFAFTRDPAAATRWAEGLRERRLVRDFWFTNADNTGITTTFVP